MYSRFLKVVKTQVKKKDKQFGFRLLRRLLASFTFTLQHLFTISGLYQIDRFVMFMYC